MRACLNNSGSIRPHLLTLYRHWAVWLPVLLLNFIVISMVLLPLQGQPFGWFHQADRSRLQLLAAGESELAEKLLGEGINTKANNDSSCVYILTSRRKFVSGYLVRAVTSLHKNLGPFRPRIYVYNADPDAGIATQPLADADRPEIREGFNIIRPDYFPSDKNIHHRESYHYGQILQHAQGRNCSWTVVVEDDVKMTSNFMPKLMNLVKDITNECEVGFVKLFDVDNMKGWSKSMEDILTMLLISAASGAGIVRVTKAIHGRFAMVPALVQFFLFVQWGACTFVLLGIIGKQRLVWAFRGRGLHETGKWGEYMGGTQGVLFPQCHVGMFARYLLENWEGKGSKIDSAVDQLLPMAARERGLKMYSAVPNLVQHIGLFSTHSGSKAHMSPVYSYSFEER